LPAHFEEVLKKIKAEYEEKVKSVVAEVAGGG